MKWDDTYLVIVKVVGCRAIYKQMSTQMERLLQQCEACVAYLSDSDGLAIDSQGGRRWTICGQSGDDLCEIGGDILSSRHTSGSSDISGSRHAGGKNDRSSEH